MITQEKDIWFELSVLTQNIGLNDVNQTVLKKTLFDISTAMRKNEINLAWKIIQSYKSHEYAHLGDALAQ